MKILAIGDISGASGVDFFESHIGALKREYNPDFIVANGENCCKVGINPSSADRLFAAGVDVITLGNHSFDDRSILNYLDDNNRIIRPANMPDIRPGVGYTVVPLGNKQICVISLMGRVGINDYLESPFVVAKRIISSVKADVFIIDIHAEATSEKKSLAYYLDGQVSVMFGTHTHVQTSDNHVMDGGCGYITDLGMTGGLRSVLGLEPEECIKMFLGEINVKTKVSTDDMRIQGAMFYLENDGKCTDVKRIDYTRGSL